MKDSTKPESKPESLLMGLGIVASALVSLGFFVVWPAIKFANDEAMNNPSTVKKGMIGFGLVSIGLLIWGVFIIRARLRDRRNRR